MVAFVTNVERKELPIRRACYLHIFLLARWKRVAVKSMFRMPCQRKGLPLPWAMLSMEMIEAVIEERGLDNQKGRNGVNGAEESGGEQEGNIACRQGK